MRKHEFFRWAGAMGLGVLMLGGCYINGTPNWEIQHEDYTPVPTGEYIPPAVSDPSLALGTRRVVLLHTNDEHSHFLGFGPNSEYPFLPWDSSTTTDTEALVAAATKIATGYDNQTVGGIVRRQYLINKIRAESADPVLTLSAGDVTMGTMLHLAMATGMGAPEYVAMTLMGYDFATLGNHEFDFGPDILANALRLANDTTFGGAVPIVTSNIHFDDVTGVKGAALASMYGEGDSGAPLVPWATKTLSNGLKIGFIGLMGYDAALVAPAKSPIAFSVPTTGSECVDADACVDDEAGFQCVRGHCVDPLDNVGVLQAIAADAQVHVNELRNNQGVDLVVALSHLGIGEDPYLAQLTSGIDVIIGGHSHDEMAPTIVPSLSTGQSIIVQAGWYGRKLGQLVLTVAPDGTVGFVEENVAATDLVGKGSTLHSVDYRLDAGILGDTDLTALPPVVSDTLERAMMLTGGVINPVVDGLNAVLGTALGPFFGQASVGIFDSVLTSDHDVIGELLMQDTNLLHLVTDAEYGVVAQQACLADLATVPTVAAQANGVIRESLTFGQPALGDPATPSVTVADIFRVLPLGASPYEGGAAAPGYPLVMFYLAPYELMAGLDVGVTKGLVADSFFLSYAGMRVTYDTTLPAFDPINPATTGRVTKIELGSDAGGYTTVLFDRSLALGSQWMAGVNPASSMFRVISNLYLTGFLDAFGLKPRFESGLQMDALSDAVLCWTGVTLNCNAGHVGIAYCRDIKAQPSDPPTAPPWLAPEVKDWQVLMSYLSGGLGGTIPTTMYTDASAGERGVPVTPRVVDATPTP